MLLRLAPFVAVLAFATGVSGGEYNKKLNIGNKAPAWENLPGIDGRKHALADLKGKELVVVLFTCNSCDAAVAYEDRISAFAKKHVTDKGKVALVAINVNTIPADRLDKMKERARDKGFSFPYLYDESQKIAKDYGANYTPEFFVLDRDRKVAYMGAFDDKTPPGEPKTPFLEQAVTALLAGKKPPTAETLARGCMIRYARPKR